MGILIILGVISLILLLLNKIYKDDEPIVLPLMAGISICMFMTILFLSAAIYRSGPSDLFIDSYRKAEVYSYNLPIVSRYAPTIAREFQYEIEDVNNQIKNYRNNKDNFFYGWMVASTGDYDTLNISTYYERVDTIWMKCSDSLSIYKITF